VPQQAQIDREELEAQRTQTWLFLQIAAPDPVGKRAVEFGVPRAAAGQDVGLGAVQAFEQVVVINARPPLVGQVVVGEQEQAHTVRFPKRRLGAHFAQRRGLARWTV
jgi:hypothetical protein